jgi:hypothetical protein
MFPGLEKIQVSFEDLIGPLEIAEAEEYWYHFAGERYGRLVTNKAVLSSMDFLLATALDPLSVPKYPARGAEDQAKLESYRRFYTPSSDSSLGYARLIHQLAQTQDLGRAAFLSLNYDIILDRCLLAGSGLAIDYRIEGFHKTDDAAAASGAPQVQIPLLKLHGSLNWRVCESCHVLRNFKSRAVWPGSLCRDCGAKGARPMLIRPTLLKDFRHRIWQMLWREAGHALASASRWVVIGYSLPLADVWILKLLLQSARSGTLPAEQRKITVVDPAASVGERFRLLFPDAVHFPGTFDSWLSEVAAGRVAL